MKITLNHSKFAKALSYTSKAISQKPNIPVLSNVLLEVTKTSIKLSATNLDMGINLWIPGIADVEGKTTVSAKFLADFILATNVEKVEIELEDDMLNVKTPKSNASFNTIPASEFPVLPHLAETPLFSIKAKDFVESLEKVIFACSTDLSIGKIQQTGVLFEIVSDNKINFVGLDNFRLSLRSSEIFNTKTDANKNEIIVPARYLSEVVRIIQDNQELEKVDVFLSESKSQIVFKIDDVEYSIRLLEGPYPDYKRIMPDDSSFSFEVSASALLEAIKIANTFARSNLGNKTLFDLNIESNEVKFKSNVAEVGENETVVSVENSDGPSDLNTAYNLKYVQDLVNHITGNTVRFESKGPLAASVFKDSNDKNFVHLIMPLRREA